MPAAEYARSTASDPPGENIGSAGRMEDLVENAYAVLQEASLEYFAGDDLRDALAENSFEKPSGGRSVGEVDPWHHYWSGRRDQWRDELEGEFPERCM
jgi:hypothetical protein